MHNKNGVHQINGNLMSGRFLDPGDVIEPTDLYESSVGKWTEAPCPGATLQHGATVRWFRPSQETAAETAC